MISFCKDSEKINSKIFGRVYNETNKTWSKNQREHICIVTIFSCNRLDEEIGTSCSRPGVENLFG